jgi:hypothetical protein
MEKEDSINEEIIPEKVIVEFARNTEEGEYSFKRYLNAPGMHAAGWEFQNKVLRKYRKYGGVPEEFLRDVEEAGLKVDKETLEHLFCLAVDCIETQYYEIMNHHDVDTDL